MFKSISWQEYLTVVGCLAAGYYAVAISVFYSKDILNKFKGARSSGDKASSPKVDKSIGTLMGSISTSFRKAVPRKQSTESLDELTIQSEPEDLDTEKRLCSPAAELLDNLEEVFMILASRKSGKGDYLRKIENLFRLAPEFSNTSTRVEIVEFVIQYFKGNQNITFTREDIDQLWENKKEEVIKSTTKNNYEN